MKTEKAGWYSYSALGFYSESIGLSCLGSCNFPVSTDEFWDSILKQVMTLYF